MAIVYCHKNKKTQEIFYIGIGKTYKRASSKLYRNKHWHNIVDKYGFYFEILYSNILWEQAKLLEVELIKKYGRICDSTGILVNQTLGGDGAVGYMHTDEWKQNNSIKHKGKIISEKQKEIISKYQKNKPKSEITKLKIKESLKLYFDKRGRLPKTKKIKISNSIWVNNTIKNKRIEEQNLTKFIDEGWIIGRVLSDQIIAKMSGKGSKWMNDGKTEKMILSKEINTFYEKGWIFGRLRK
jgi:hypothetical protein